jgi:hypothetical protein
LRPFEALPTNWGAWHSAVIEVRAERLRVNIDGTPVQDVDIASHPELQWRLKRGFIGFPDLGYAYAVRNVRLQDLGDSTKFVELFDGQSCMDGSCAAERSGRCGKDRFSPRGGTGSFMRLPYSRTASSPP